MRLRLVFLAALFLISLQSRPSSAADTSGVKLNWLDAAAPATTQPVSWGVPWPQGQVKKDTTFTLSGGKGDTIPVQTWPLAYWPDGSLKWTGHAAAVPAGAEGLTITAAQATAAAATTVRVDQTADAVTVSTGPMTCRIPKSGSSLIDSIALGDKTVAKTGQLLCTLEDRS